MKKYDDHKSGLSRRDLLKGIAAAGMAFTAGAQIPTLTAAAAPTGDNPIRKENAKPGTKDWILTNTYIDPDTWWRSPRIEGYCSEPSVRTGDTLKIMVSTNPVSEFSLEIFRTGYYGGKGGRLMKTFESIPGKTQPDPPVGENRLRECKWEPSVELTIPDDWVSGVYLGKLTAKKDGVYWRRVQSYVIFIVSDDRPCDLLFQCSDLTWQSYNSWPNDEWSLYHANGYLINGLGRKKWLTGERGWVSFDRPYANFCQRHLVHNPKSVGSGEFLLWEFPLSYWMEQQGYDVSYISNVDTHVDGLPGLLRAKGFISVGHDEYWTLEMYDNVSAARDSGVNIAFLSGNSVSGEVGLLPSAESQPRRIFRQHSRFGLKEAMLMGGRMAGISGGDWICRNQEHWLYEGTGIKEGDAIKDLIGWEYHGFPDMDLPGMEILAYSPMAAQNGEPKPPHVATIYNGPKGNVVFDAGSIWYAQGMSSPPGHILPGNFGAHPQGPDPRVQRITENLFERFTKNVNR
jgi:hypothetical protein